jgi:oligosaccharide repeat unit polymerase
VGLISFGIVFFYGNALRFQFSSDVTHGPLYSLATVLSNLLQIAILLALFQYKRIWHPIWIGLFLAELGIGLVTGSKQLIFQTFLPILFYYHYLHRPSTGKVLVTGGVLAVVFVFIFFPLVQNYRTVYYDVLGYRPNPSVSDIFSATNVFYQVIFSESGSNSESITTGLIQRVNWLDSVVMIVRYVPNSMDHIHGETLLPILTGWIPRVIWPDKPTLGFGSYMVQVIIGSKSMTNKGLTAVGELYLNFGLLGIIPGMLLLGMFTRWVYDFTHRFSPSSLLRALMYMELFPVLIFSMQSSLSSMLLGAIRTILFVLVVCWFLRLMPRRRNFPTETGIQYRSFVGNSQ